MALSFFFSVHIVFLNNIILTDIMQMTFNYYPPHVQILLFIKLLISRFLP